MPYQRPGCGWTSHSIDEASQHRVSSMVVRLTGTSILLVQQDVTIVLDLCHRAFVMDRGASCAQALARSYWPIRSFATPVSACPSNDFIHRTAFVQF